MKNHFLAIASAFLFFSFVLSQSLSAQMLPGDFSAYSHYVDKVMGVQWKKLQGFVDLKQRGISWSPGVGKRKGNIGIAYEAALQSKDGDCLILYPDMDIMHLLIEKLLPPNRKVLRCKEKSCSLQGVISIQSVRTDIRNA